MCLFHSRSHHVKGLQRVILCPKMHVAHEGKAIPGHPARRTELAVTTFYRNVAQASGTFQKFFFKLST